MSHVRGQINFATIIRISITARTSGSAGAHAAVTYLSITARDSATTAIAWIRHDIHTCRATPSLPSRAHRRICDDDVRNIHNIDHIHNVNDVRYIRCVANIRNVEHVANIHNITLVLNITNIHKIVRYRTIYDFSPRSWGGRERAPCDQYPQ
jgi:hypothetical protein